MTRWKLAVEQRAEDEARAAFLWYLARSPRAAGRFQAAVEACIEVIAESPERHPEIAPGIRRRLVSHRFPYAVLYRILVDQVQVLAVMHTRRPPGYWHR